MAKLMRSKNLHPHYRSTAIFFFFLLKIYATKYFLYKYIFFFYKSVEECSSKNNQHDENVNFFAANKINYLSLARSRSALKIFHRTHQLLLLYRTVFHWQQLSISSKKKSVSKNSLKHFLLQLFSLSSTRVGLFFSPRSLTHSYSKSQTYHEICARIDSRTQFSRCVNEYLGRVTSDYIKCPPTPHGASVCYIRASNRTCPSVSARGYL